MKRVVRGNRRLLACIAVLALVAGAFAWAVPSAEASGNEQCTQYYSDATYTELVGAKCRFCNGEVSQWGIVTQFKLHFVEECR